MRARGALTGEVRNGERGTSERRAREGATAMKFLSVARLPKCPAPMMDRVEDKTCYTQSFSLCLPLSQAGATERELLFSFFAATPPQSREVTRGSAFLKCMHISSPSSPTLWRNEEKKNNRFFFLLRVYGELLYFGI